MQRSRARKVVDYSEKRLAQAGLGTSGAPAWLGLQQDHADASESALQDASKENKQPDPDSGPGSQGGEAQPDVRKRASSSRCATGPVRKSGSQKQIDVEVSKAALISMREAAIDHAPIRKAASKPRRGSKRGSAPLKTNEALDDTQAEAGPGKAPAQATRGATSEPAPGKTNNTSSTHTSSHKRKLSQDSSKKQSGTRASKRQKAASDQQHTVPSATALAGLTQILEFQLYAPGSWRHVLLPVSKSQTLNILVSLLKAALIWDTT